MNVTFSGKALKDLRGIDKKRQQQIFDHISAFENDPSSVKIQKLKGYDNQFRLRVGFLRIRLEIHWADGQAEVKRIKDRKDAYKNI
jgi:mRNA interferase RelE/StbE